MARHRNKKDSLPVLALSEAHQSTPNAELIPVKASQLHTLSQRTSLARYFKDLWLRRYFIVADARAKAFRENHDYRLGMAWVVLDPFLNAITYGFMFGFLLNTARGIDNFIGFLLIGATFFSFINRLLMGGNGLVQSKKNLLQSFNFPRASIVLSQSLYRFFEYLPSAAITVAVAVALGGSDAVSWKIILSIPLMILLHIFGTGLMFFTARLSAFVPDVRAVLSFVTRPWFYMSGIFFTAERFEHIPAVYNFIIWNPAYRFLDALRDSVIYATLPTLETWIFLTCCSFGTFVLGFMYFWLAEQRYAKIF